MNAIAAAAPAATSAASITPPKIGEVWPGQGGRYVGALRDRNGGPDIHYVVPPNEVLDKLNSLAYGGYGHSVEGADSTWDGAANTSALLADSEEHPAAKACAELEHDGCTGYHLATSDEAALVRANLGDQAPEGYYWLSRQSSAYGAWITTFPGGDQLYGLKVNYYRALAVRRVPAI